MDQVGERKLEICRQLLYGCLMNELKTHIVINKDIRFGKPCIKGTRISVGDILQWLSADMTEQEILEDYPELQKIHIKAALAFAAERDAMTKVIVHEAVT